MDAFELNLRNDIERLKSPAGYLYAGIPHFKGLYGRDSLIAAWQLLERDSGIARDTLKFLANYQGKKVERRSEEEPGKILHVFDYAPSGFLHWLSKLLQGWTHGFPYYGSVDSTALFIIVAGEYFRQTGDRESLAGLWPNIVLAVRWMAKYGDLDEDGFLEYTRKNPFGLRNQGWKDTTVYLSVNPPVAPVEVQGYAYAAYKSAVYIARALSKGLEDWDTRAEQLKEKFNSAFWVESLKFFALALGGSKRQVREVASNPGHLLFTGILDPTAEKAVVDRLFKSDMFTGYGLRTHSDRSRYFGKSCTLGAIWPHDNWMVWLGLKRCGYTDKAQMIRAALLKACRELGYAPEYYDVAGGKPLILPRFWRALHLSGPCHPQAWASAALLDMLNE